LIWSILVVLAILALRQYIAFNRDLSEELRRFRPLRWLVNAWPALQSQFPENQPGHWDIRPAALAAFTPPGA